MDINIKKLLELAVANKASDIHLIYPYTPYIRVDGNLIAVTQLLMEGEVEEKHQLQQVHLLHGNLTKNIILEILFPIMEVIIDVWHIISQQLDGNLILQYLSGLLNIFIKLLE